MQDVTTVLLVKALVPELPGQSVQSAAPVATLNVSAKQAVGVPPFGPVNPASATQAKEPVMPAVPLLDGHTEHGAAPVSALNVSTKQAVGVPPSGPV